MSETKSPKIDPLYTIFEKHLYEFQQEEGADSDFRELIVENVVEDYMEFLRDRKVAVPTQWEGQIVDEIKAQVRNMLVKKTYGCLTVGEFIKGQPKAKRKEARRKYRKLG